MTLWRLEWLRLVRTRRLVVIIAAYVFFGLTGPVSARYLGEILNRIGGGIRVELPPPTPADGLAQFTSNASQICLLVLVLVAAAGLALDAHTEMATFLRTRVPRMRDLILPAYAMTTAAAVAGLVAGSLAAWYETTVLLGAPPAGKVILGTVLSALFLGFAVACTAAAAYLVRGVVATAGTSLVFLLVLAIVGNLPRVGRWSPTTLLGALPNLVRGTAASHFLPAAVVCVVAAIGALSGAVWLASRREL
jgi:ABC-2 type transport system permease protein